MVWQVNLPPGIIKNAAEQLGVELDDTTIEQLESEITRNNEENRIRMKQEELKRAQKFPKLARNDESDEESVSVDSQAGYISNDQNQDDSYSEAESASRTGNQKQDILNLASQNKNEIKSKWAISIEPQEIVEDLVKTKEVEKQPISCLKEASEYRTPRKILGEKLASDLPQAINSNIERVQSQNLHSFNEKHSLVSANNPKSTLRQEGRFHKSKSVVFDDAVNSLEKDAIDSLMNTVQQKDYENRESPLKLFKQNKSNPSQNIVTPKKSQQLLRSSGKGHGSNYKMTLEDCENDASLAFSSGKNSRRKLSVIRNQAKDYDDYNGPHSGHKVGGLFNQNSSRNNTFESSRKQSSTLRCLQENDMLDSVFSNAPRKSFQRQTSARHL